MKKQLVILSLMVGLFSSLSIDAAPAWWSQTTQRVRQASAPAWWNNMTQRIKQTGGNFGRMWRCAGWNADKHGCSSSEKMRARAWVFGAPAATVAILVAGAGVGVTKSDVDWLKYLEELQNEKMAIAENVKAHISHLKEKVGNAFTWFEVLDVTKYAPFDLVTKAYKRMSLRYHPDKFSIRVGEELANQVFKIISDAYSRAGNIKEQQEKLTILKAPA